MKHLKFISSLLLCALLLSVFLPACSSKKTEKTEPAPSPSEGTPSEESSTKPSDGTPSLPSVKPSADSGSESPSTEPEPTATPYKHVVVIGVDGAGTFFKSADTPNIDKIFENGAVSYKCLTSAPTISAQCWGSLLHGVTPVFHKLTNSIVENTAYPTDSPFPSFFKVIRQNDKDAVLASFTHWNPINVGIVENDIDVHKMGNMDDRRLAQAICSYVKKNDPKALFVQFDETDSTGHSVGYGTKKHLEKITEVDGYIGQIYEAYEKKGLLDETLFIVTADHGGNGTSHGGLTDSEKYVMFAASGKSVEKGEIEDIEIRDTAAIVLYALGYDCPETWTARVPSGLFKGVTASDRPVYVNKDSDRYHEPEPTPEKDSEKYITNFVTKTPLKVYLPFDGNSTDVQGNKTSESGKLYFVEGYYGQGVSLDDGYVSLDDFKPGTDSFTVSMWLKTEGSGGDPAIISNKDWESGKNKGIILSLRNGEDIRFNVGNGSSRMDADAILPSDYNEGWMHILLIVDREQNKVRFCYDFGLFSTTAIPSSLAKASFDGISGLNIGQDGTGVYEHRLPATVDELMIFDGALDTNEAAALAAYYGKTLQSSPSFRDRESSPTPEKDSKDYVTNFIKDKELSAYITFDEKIADQTGKSTLTEHGTISYKDGVFGKAAVLDKGFVSIENYAPEKNSFSAAFWINTKGVKGDPGILSNKNWQSGGNAGWILSFRDTPDVKFNFGNGSSRMDQTYALPGDFADGWVYMVLVVDREANKVKLSMDFGEFIETDIPDSLKNASANGYDVLNVGQDGTGKLQYPLTGALDELMLFDGVLDEKDVAALASYYGI